MFSVSPGTSQETVVDGIVAVVNGELITLTDYRIVREFGIHRLRMERGATLSPQGILDGLIDQKLIILITNADIDVPLGELERRYEQLSESLGGDAFQQKMGAFDLTREELYVYMREMITSRMILEQRFQRTISVTLREIEAYYRQSYLPEQEAQGLDPRPMLEILDILEAEVKSEETRLLSEEWIRNLRKEADIQVFAEEYPEFFKRHPDRENVGNQERTRDKSNKRN
jgi:hypothetical protein